MPFFPGDSREEKIIDILSEFWEEGCRNGLASWLKMALDSAEEQTETNNTLSESLSNPLSIHLESLPNDICTSVNQREMRETESREGMMGSNYGLMGGLVDV
jgi:hypothetical protein